MGDVSTGLAYLCCCMRDPEDPVNAARVRDGAAPDPREREIDKMFMQRDYKRDASGRFVKARQQPAPTDTMALGEHVHGGARAPDAATGHEHQMDAKHLQVPQLFVTDTTSANGAV